MNSSQPSTTDREVLPAPVQPVFDWIEVVAIPIATNIMETQPIMMVLFFVTVVFAGSATPLPLGEVGITLLLLGLQWWAMFINYRLHRGIEQRTASILHVLGVAIAFGLVLTAHLTTFDLPTIFVIAGLVIFCWKRGIDKAKDELNDEQLIFVFKVGVAILLVALVLGVLSSDGPLMDISGVLSYALPLFFLSGLLSLSFTRVSMIRREHIRQGIPQANSTRSWLVALTFLWGVLVVGALTLETFSFHVLQILFLPLWNIIAFIVAWIIYAILWVLLFIYQALNALFHFKPAPIRISQMPVKSTPHGLNPLSHAQLYPTWLLLIGRILFVVLALLVLFIIFRAILHHLHPRLEQDSEEEIREALSMRSILRERRQEHKTQVQQKTGALLDSLDPNSVRAHYRELLQQMAEHGEPLSRRSEETPMEYQKRLVALLERSPDVSLQGDIASDREILTALTHAYMDERYGERQIEAQEHTVLSTWISHLADRIGGRRV